MEKVSSGVHEIRHQQRERKYGEVDGLSGSILQSTGMFLVKESSINLNGFNSSSPAACMMRAGKTLLAGQVMVKHFG